MSTEIVAVADELAERREVTSEQIVSAVAALPDAGRAADQFLVQVVAQIRALHTVVEFPSGARFCDHCCLNRALDRRFACHHNHIHHNPLTPPCPMLDILERLGL